MIRDVDLLQLRKDLPTIKAISSVFGASEALVRRWYNGQRAPSPRYREKIRSYLMADFPFSRNLKSTDPEARDNEQADAVLDFLNTQFNTIAMLNDRRILNRKDGRIFRP